MADNSKTPVSLLQEFCVEYGLPLPIYNVIGMEGADHQPTFTYEVVVGEEIIYGKGAAKKEAKQDAAENMLKILPKPKFAGEPKNLLKVSRAARFMQKSTVPVKRDTSDLFNDSTAYPAYNSTRLQYTVPARREVDSVGNPVGVLQELCQKEFKPLPSYVFSTDSSYFVCTVILGGLIEKGRAQSKKLSKNRAAEAMLSRLDKNVSRPGSGYTPLYTTVGAQFNDVDGEAEEEEGEPEDTLSELGNAFNSPIEQTLPIMTEEASFLTNQFYLDMKKSSGKCLQELQTLYFDDTCDFIKIFKDLSNEQKFKFVFVDIKDKNSRGQYQCLMHLSTMPVAVLFGVGETREASQEQAAYNALQYLKIMTK